MTDRVVPMIHVPDVRATVDWYKDIGFTVDETYDDGGKGLSFAILSFGSSQVMFNQGGRKDERHRREVDLYVYTDDVDQLYSQLGSRVDVVEPPHDTFYGMREFIFRDLNRFWITFGEPSVFQMLMSGAREGKIEVVRLALQSGRLKPESLTVALVEATGEVAEMLRNAGASPPFEVDRATLQSYAGTYRSEQGFKVEIELKDGRLIAAPDEQQPVRLIAIDETTFRSVSLDDESLSFSIEEGKAIGFVFRHGPHSMSLKRES